MADESTRMIGVDVGGTFSHIVCVRDGTIATSTVFGGLVGLLSAVAFVCTLVVPETKDADLVQVSWDGSTAAPVDASEAAG